MNFVENKETTKSSVIITPTLKTPRLILRPFCKNDAQAAFSCWESDPDVAKYMLWTSHNNIEQTKEWIDFELAQINNEKWFRFALELKTSKELIGTAILYYEDEVSGWEIGYNLGKHFWNYGYTTEAMQRILLFAKEDLFLKEIVGRYANENTASANVMKKLGFQYEKDISYYCNDSTVCRQGTQCRLNLNNK